LNSPVDTSAIGREAAQAPHEAASINDQLANKLDQVDLLIADLGQISEFTASANKFTDEAATEIKWNRKARVATLVCVLVIIVGLFIMLSLVLSIDTFKDLRSNPVAFSTTLVAIIGGTVILAKGVSSSVFSSFADRNGGMPMPEHLKTVLDGIGSVFKSH
jgi:hypothetical protein